MMIKPTEEQLRCAAIVKKCHASLRMDAAKYGESAAWNNHINNEDTLREYATAMNELARFWKNNNGADTGQCRISWVRDRIWKYFKDRDCDRIRRREIILEKNGSIVSEEMYLTYDDNIKVLDVGSCYNPLADISWIDVTAVDLCPSVPSVLRGDFLAVDVDRDIQIEDYKLLQLPTQYFHTVLFSLLLEYLPSKEQRKEACRRAYEILEPAGLLIIITPDSNRTGANWKLMADWRNTLAMMGFMRVYYDKLQHIHCMAFRKCYNPQTSKLWAQKNDKSYFTREIFIPQDFNKDGSDETCMNDTQECRIDPGEVLCTFQEMPFLSLDL